MKRLLILLILVLFMPIFFLGFGTDAHVFAYMARLIIDGGVPYVDGWDHKGISLYFINAIGYGLFGFKSLMGIRILEVLLILYAFLSFFRNARSKYDKLVVFIATVFGLFTFKYFFDGGNLTEEYGAIFSLLSVLLLMKKESRTRDLAIVGALFVINFTIRANLIGFWIALFITYAAQLMIQQKRIKTVLGAFIKMGYGAALIFATIAIYLWSTDSFQDFYDAAFTFNFSYTGGSKTSVFNTMFTVMKTYHLSLILVIGWIIAFVRFLRDRSRFLELLLLIWIPVELYLSNLSPRRFAHYYLMWMPLILFSVTLFLTEMKDRFNMSNFKIIGGSLLLFCVCYYVPSYMSLMDWKKVVLEYGNQQSKNVVAHIRAAYPEHTLLVWGNNADIYNKVDKISPVSYFYQSLFKFNTPLIQEKSKELSDQVITSKPQLIIDAHRSGMISLDRSNNDQIDDAQKANLKKILDFINSDYVKKEQKFGYDFYELRNE